ncbi:MAG: methyltransferase [Eggerthellaceae bacterium]|nr:methyltransferase [Eggerthellaceae bacterium]
MGTKRQNAEAILARKQPDYYFDFMDSLALMPDPVMMSDMTAEPGGPENKDSWGVTYVWPEGAPGPHPISRPETLVIPDIEHWEDYLKVPQIRGLDWSVAEAEAAKVDREEQYVAVFCAGGLFERSHHLMGLENALINYLDYPDEVFGLLQVIKEYKFAYLEEAAAHIHPDVVFFHDDWGHKRNIFLPPDVWRKLIKPLHTEIIAKAHELGIFFLHHADCICQPLVTDMVEMGVDAWQGVIAQNDIVEIQRVTEGKLPMVGGYDSPKIDVLGTTDADVRAEVHRVIDTYCPGGRFFPGIPNGFLYTPGLMDIYVDEMAKYGRQWAEEHPIA